MPKRYKMMRRARKPQKRFERWIPPMDTIRDIRKGESIPSVSLSAPSVHPRMSSEERLEISRQYTIAPAYNKGAYQVVPKNEIQSIGKK